MSSSGERTEKATSRRRQQARDKGQFPYSQEATSALTLITCLVTLLYTLGSPSSFRGLLEGMLSTAATPSISDQVFINAVRQAGAYFLAAAAPVMVAAVVAALGGNVLQGLPIFAPEKAGLKWNQLNPVQGLSRLKTKISPLEWLKFFFICGVVGLVVWNTVSAYWEQVITSSALSVASTAELTRSVIVGIVGPISVALAVLAAADYFLQRWRFEQSIKQTKAEVKEDNKALEGNPLIKGKIRSIQRETARRRMMARIKDADVIVTNPTHYAVALEYKPGKMAAPRVIAKGRNWLAQRIKKVGREYDIPTVENVPLARALYRSVEIEQEIPMELYKAVAEVLAYVFRIRKKK
jgi:flagellar biosynthetic protein FlhB